MNFIRLKFQSFYIQNYLKIQELYSRGEYISYFIQIIRFIQLISLIFSSEFLDHIDTSSNNTIESQLIDYTVQFLEAFRFSFIIDDQDVLKIVVKVILFAINSSLLIWFAVLILAGYQIESSIYKIISFYMKIYYYVVFIPSLTLSAYFSTEAGSIMEIISIISIIEDLFIIFVICYHDNSLQFDVKDHLFKFDPFSFYIEIPLISVSCLVVHVHKSFFINGILLLFVTLAELAEIFRNGSYHCQKNGMLNAKIQFITLILCILSVVQILSSVIHANSVSCLFVIIPITWKLSQHIYNKILSKHAKQQISSSDNLSKTNVWNRVMYRICKENELSYFNSENGVIVESLILLHIQQCNLQSQQAQKECFCYQLRNQIQQKDKYQQEVVRRNFIFNIMEENFRQKLNKKRITDNFNFRLSYIYFLLQALQCPIKTQLQIKMLFLNKEKLSLRNLSLLNQVDEISSNIIYGKKKYKKDEFQNAIMFDSRIALLNSSSRKCYIQKRDFFEFLSQSTIDIKQLFEKGTKLYQQMKQVEFEIYKLMSINSMSKRLNEVTSLFMSVFDLRRKEMRKQNFISQRHMMNSYAHSSSIKQEMSLDLFSTRNSCVINMSLLNKLGEIKECTKSVSQIFMLTQKEIIGQNVSLLMPPSIGENHNKILKNFITNGNQYHLQNDKKYFFLGQDKLGQIVPLRAQMQLHVKQDDFCVVSFLSKVNSTNHYILFQRDSQMKYWQISNISKGLNQYLLPSIEASQPGKNNLKNISLEKLIPMMTIFNGLVTNDQRTDDFWSKEQSTLFFHPKNQQQFNYLTKHKLKQQYYDSEAFNKLMVALIGDNFGFIEIRFVIQEIYSSIYFMEITSIRFIKRQADINESIAILANQLNSFMQKNRIDLNLSELRRLIDQIKSSQSVLDLADDVKLHQYSVQSLLNLQGSLIKSDLHQQVSNQNLDSLQSFHKNEEVSYEFIQEYQQDFKSATRNLNQTVSKDMYVIEEDQLESNKNQRSSYINNNIVDPNISFNRQRDDENKFDEIKFHDEYDVQQYNEEDVIDFQLETTARKNNITNRELINVQPSDTNREMKSQIYVEPYIKEPKKEYLNTSHLGVTQNVNVSLLNNFEEMHDMNRQNKFEEINHENNKSIMDLSSINLMKQQNDGTLQNYNQNIQQKENNQLNSYTIERIDSYSTPQKSFMQVVKDMKKNDQSNTRTTFNSHFNQLANVSTQHIDLTQQIQPSQSQLKGVSANSFPHLDIHPIDKQTSSFPVLLVNHQNDDEEDHHDDREQTERFQSEKDVSNKASSMTNNFNMNQGYENINPDALVDQSNSSKTRTELSSTKRRIAYIITSKRQNVLIKTINYFGYLALLLLGFITLFVFFTLQSNLNTMIDNLEQIPRGTDLMQSSSFVILNREIIRADEYKAFFVDLTDEQIEHFKESYDESINDFRDQINSLTVVPNKFGFVDYVNNEQISITQTDENGSVSDHKNLTIIYAISDFYYNLQQYITTDSEQNRGFVLRNYLNFQVVYQQIRDLTQQEAHDSNENIQSVLIWTFILIELVSALNIFMILPIYYKVQLYREEILKLFATFPKEKLISMNNYMNRIINSRFYKSHSSGGILSSGRLSSNNFYKDNAFKVNSHIKWKNKVISNTTNLKKFNIAIFFSCLIILILISIYPTINFSVCHPYLEQFLVFFEEYLILQKAKSQLCFAYAISFTRLTCSIETKTILNGQLDEYYNTYLTTQNKQTLDELNSIPSNFQEISRYHEDQQVQILLNPLQSNLCQFMRDLKSSSLFDSSIANEPEEFELCDEVYQGQLTKGMILTVKYTFDILSELYSIASTSSGTNEIPLFEKWDEYNKLTEFDEMNDLILQFIDIISKYLFQEYKELFNLLHLIQYILLSYSIVILLFAFLFGWRYFIQYSNQQIIQTKIILSVLNIDHIVDNSYIFSYFKKQFGQSQ